MKYDLVFHSDVQADYNDSYSWYENQKEGLGEEFLIAVRKKLEQIVENPEAFSVKYRKDYREAFR